MILHGKIDLNITNKGCLENMKELNNIYKLFKK